MPPPDMSAFPDGVVSWLEQQAALAERRAAVTSYPFLRGVAMSRAFARDVREARAGLRPPAALAASAGTPDEAGAAAMVADWHRLGAPPEPPAKRRRVSRS